MMKVQFVSVSLASAVTALSGAAFAESDTERSDAAPAVMSDALELTIAGSFTHVEGDIAGTQRASDVSGEGGGGELSIGYRVTPNFALALYGGLHGFRDGAAADRDSLTWSAGAKADWHFAPAAHLDPWVSVGAGVKSLWIGRGEELERRLVGIELARAQLGVDYRIASSFAIGPFVGASATMYTHDRTEMVSDYDEIGDKDVNWTFHLGVLGRFDIAAQ